VTRTRVFIRAEGEASYVIRVRIPARQTAAGSRSAERTNTEGSIFCAAGVLVSPVADVIDKTAPVFPFCFITAMIGIHTRLSVNTVGIHKAAIAQFATVLACRVAATSG